MENISCVRVFWKPKKQTTIKRTTGMTTTTHDDNKEESLSSVRARCCAGNDDFPAPARQDLLAKASEDINLIVQQTL